MREEKTTAEVWLSIREVGNLLGCTRQAVEKQIKLGKLETRTVRGKGGKGGERTEIRISSLPAEAQVRYLNEKAGGDIQSAERPKGESRGARNLAELPDSFVETGERRLKVVKEVLSLKKDKAFTPKMRQIASREGASLGTIYRWLKAYRESGMDPLSLMPEKRRRGYASFDQEAAQHLLGLYCRPEQPKVYECYVLTKKKAKEKGWNVGSYATACRIIQGYDNAVKTLGRQGKKAFRDRFEPKILRDYSELEINDTWVADHTVLNLIVHTDPLSWAATRTSRREYARPWLTAFMDLRSRMITGFHLSFMPSSQTIALGLRHAVLPKDLSSADMQILFEKIGVDIASEFRYFVEWVWPAMGLPWEIYIDNGKDFRARRFEGQGWYQFGQIDYDVKQASMLEEMNITARHTIPYLARGKPIESFFRPLKEFMGTLPGGWQGKNFKEADKAKIEQDKRDGRILTIGELRLMLELWLVFVYHLQPHRGQGMQGKRPMQVWVEERENTALRTVSSRAMDFLLMKVDQRTVSDKGIRIFNEFYESLDLMPLIGRKVEVRYEPGDISTVHVFCGNQYVCTAESVKYSSMHPSEEDLKEKLRQQRQYRKGVAKELKRIQERGQYPDPLERIMAIKDERARGMKPRPGDESGGEVVHRTRFDDVPVEELGSRGAGEQRSRGAEEQVLWDPGSGQRGVRGERIRKEPEEKKPIFTWQWERDEWEKKQREKKRKGREV